MRRRMSSVILSVSLFLLAAAPAGAQWQRNGDAVTTEQTTWKVGLGTSTTPSVALDVGGDCALRGFASFGSAATGSRINANGSTAAGIWLRYTDNNAYYDSDAATFFRVNAASALTDGMMLSAGGWLGIGSTSPAARLHINDGAQYTPRILLSGTEYYQAATRTGGLAMLLGVNRPDNKQLWIADSEQLGQPGVVPTIVRIMVGGPTATIDAMGTDASARTLRVGPRGVVMATEGGKVGIGTDSPVHTLDVQASSDATFPTTPITMRIADRRAFSTSNAGSGIGFGAMYTASDMTTIGAIAAVKESTAAGHFGGALTFGTREHGSGGGSMERMRITSTGEVIIGQPLAAGQTPARRLTVHGEIFGATAIGAVYQDLAEWVPASEDMTPGTVVVLDRTVNNQVMPSQRAYDTAVAGVVSAQPGVILGVGGPEKEQIATTGRVKVKVDATRGAIAIGDILVTSDRSGMAMKSQPIDLGGIGIHRPGTVIGKALEPLAGGYGEILVLLSLQ